MLSSLPKVIQKHWIHLAAWAVLLLYVVFAYDLYNHFILRHGKPALISTELPEKTGQIFIVVDYFKPTFYDGQYSYLMVGWAFSGIDTSLRPEDYERQVILISNERNYFFAVENELRPDVDEANQLQGMNLQWAGFSTLISKEAVAPGVYQVSVSFHNPRDGSTYYGQVDRYIIRTPNQIYMSDSPSHQ